MGCAVGARCQPEDVEYNFGQCIADSKAFGLPREADLAACARAAVDTAHAITASPSAKWRSLVDLLLEQVVIDTIETDVALLRADAASTAAAADVVRKRAEAEEGAEAEMRAIINLDRLKVVELQDELSALLAETASLGASL